MLRSEGREEQVTWKDQVLPSTVQNRLLLRPERENTTKTLAERCWLNSHMSRAEPRTEQVPGVRDPEHHTPARVLLTGVILRTFIML